MLAQKLGHHILSSSDRVNMEPDPITFPELTATSEFAQNSSIWICECFGSHCPQSQPLEIRVIREGVRRFGEGGPPTF
jgi:hypothetical protein